MATKPHPSPASRYHRLDGVEHVLRRPDTYVGSLSPAPTAQWILRDDDGALERREVTASPALLKVVDEILVNAADNKQRDAATSRVDVEVDAASGTIAVSNNGRSIPLDAHPTERDGAGKPIRIPELVFGSLLSGENFDDNELRTVGGRNGLGAKLANIFSTRFEVSLVSDETAEGGGTRRR